MQTFGFGLILAVKVDLKPTILELIDKLAIKKLQLKLNQIYGY